MFEGNHHTISNLYIDRSSTDDVGLFGALGSGSEVRNLGIVGGSVTGNLYVGGLVGWNPGTISMCYATGNDVEGGSLRRRSCGAELRLYKCVLCDWDCNSNRS